MLDALVGFTALLVRRDQVEVSIYLVVVEELVGALEGLQARVHPVEGDGVLADQVFHDQPQRALADGRVQDDLEVLEQLFETFDRAMAERQMQAVLAQIFLLDFADNPFEVDDHDHLVPVALPPAKVQPPALELEDPVGLGLHELRVVK